MESRERGSRDGGAGGWGGGCEEPRWASGRRPSVHVGLVGGVLPRGRCPAEDQVRQNEVHKPENEKELATSARRQLSVESGSWQSRGEPPEAPWAEAASPLLG